MRQDVALFIDPTIRFESSDDQTSEVNEEKKRIYERVNASRSKWNLNGLKVISILIGARSRYSTKRNFFNN